MNRLLSFLDAFATIVIGLTAFVALCCIEVVALIEHLGFEVGYRLGPKIREIRESPMAMLGKREDPCSQPTQLRGRLRVEVPAPLQGESCEDWMAKITPTFRHNYDDIVAMQKKLRESLGAQ